MLVVRTVTVPDTVQQLLGLGGSAPLKMPQPICERRLPLNSFPTGLDLAANAHWPTVSSRREVHVGC